MFKKLLLAASILSFSISAEIIKKPCSVNDYHFMMDALDNYELVGSNTEDQLSLYSMLQEEIVPTCNKIFDTEVFATIPGRKFYDFEFTTELKGYKLTIIEDMESSRNTVRIEKK